MIRYYIMALAVIAYIFMPFSTAAASAFSDRVAGMAEIKGIRVSAMTDKVRIVVDADKEVDYSTSVLSNPSRVVVDLSGAWLGPQVKKSIDIDSRFAKTVRIAQHDPKTVRVVIETSVGKNNYDVFSLTGGSSPYRVVMDFGSIGQGTAGSEIKLSDKDTGASSSSSSSTTTTPETTPAAAEQPAASRPDTSAADEAAKNTPSGTAAETPAEPVYTAGLSGKVIAIDAGHGGNDTGAIGPTGVTEKSITLRIANEVQRLLTAAGAQVYMTRTTDTEVSPKHESASDVEELQARCDVANDHKSDIFVCIHMDSFSSSAAKGTTGYYYSRGSATSQRLADDIRAGVVASLGTESRGTKSCNFYVVKHTTMPATLVEVAFVSNPSEEQMLNSEEGVHKAAQGIVQGIRDFFGQ